MSFPFVAAEESFPVLFRNIGCRGLLGFIGDTCRIGTQIRDDADSTASLDVDAFIELLCDPHGLLGREIQEL